MSSKKDMDRLVRGLRDQGFEVELTGGGHYRVSKPGGEGCVHMAYTPSDHRALKNARSRLRAIGWEEPPSSGPKGKKGKK